MGFAFVSYSRHDAWYVRELVALLRDAGIDVWVDYQIPTGGRWDKVVRVQIEECSVFILVMTPSAEESRWVAAETDWAMSKRKPILPLLLAGKPFFGFGRTQYHDVVGGAMPTPEFVDRLRFLSTAGEENHGDVGLPGRTGDHEPVSTALETSSIVGESYKNRCAKPATGPLNLLFIQFEEVTSGPGGKIARDVLGVLHAARGPMTATDLAAVLQIRNVDVDAALVSVRDFVVGTSAFELGHPDSRTVVTDRLTVIELSGYQQMLSAWVQSFADAGWPSETPEYVAAHHAITLRLVGDNEALYKLIDSSWMKLRHKRCRSPLGFARDVLLSIEAAEVENPLNWAQMLRGSLLYASVTTMVQTIPSEAIGLLAQLDDSSRALDYATLLPETDERSEAYRLIAAALVRLGKTVQASTAANRAFEVLRSNAGAVSAREWAGVAVVLAATGETGRARQAAELASEAVWADRARWKWHLVGDVIAAGEALAASGLEAEVVVLAERITHLDFAESDRYGAHYALGNLALVLARSGQEGRAVAVATKIDNDGERERALTDVVDELAKSGWPDRALAAVPIGANNRPLTTCSIAVAYIKEGEADKAVTMVKKVLGIERRDQFWVGIAEAFAEVGQADRAATAIDNIQDSVAKAITSARVASTLALAGHTTMAESMTNTALILSENVTDPDSLAALAAALAQAGHIVSAEQIADRALIAADTSIEGWRAARFIRVAEVLVEAGLNDQAVAAAGHAQIATEQLDGETYYGFAKIASILATAGNTGRAGKVAKKAITIATKCNDGLDLVATTLARAGLTEYALIAANALNDGYSGYERRRVLAAVATELAGAGKVNDGIAAAMSIARDENEFDLYRSLYDRNKGLAGVARKLIDAHRLSDAADVVERIMEHRSPPGRLPDIISAGSVMETQGGHAAYDADTALMRAQSIPENRFDGWERCHALADVEIMLVRTGQVAHALAVAREIDQVWTRAYLLAAVARELQEVGQTSQAAAVASQAHTLIPDITDYDQERRRHVLPEIAEVLISTGLTTLAISAARSEADPYTRAKMFSGMLDTAAEGEKGLIANGALDAASEAPEKDKAKLYSDIAWSLARAGIIEQALVTARQVRLMADQLDAVRREHEVKGAAAAFALAGQLDEAIAMTVGPSSSKYGFGIGFVVRVLLEAGKIDEAVATIRRVPDQNFDKAELLAKAATSYSKAGSMSQAIVLTCQAFAAARLSGRESYFRMWRRQPELLNAIDPTIDLKHIVQVVVEAETMITGSE